MERSSSSFSHKTIPRMLRMNKNKIVTDHMRLSKSENPFKSASVLYHQVFISLQEILITTAFDGWMCFLVCVWKNNAVECSFVFGKANMTDGTGINLSCYLLLVWITGKTVCFDLYIKIDLLCAFSEFLWRQRGAEKVHQKILFERLNYNKWIIHLLLWCKMTDVAPKFLLINKNNH